MNCEICKSKKATLFYADEGGIRHALCAECGESINKLGKVEGKKEQIPKYIPEPSLCSFIECAGDLSAHVKHDARPRAVCQSCGCSLEEIIESGKFGCPDCYESFDDSIGTRYSGDTDSASGRMPSSRRFDIDRRALLESLKSDLRGAIDAENFELAASLRDKIKKLKEKTKIHN